MEDNVLKLEYQGKEITLIGTAHVSKKSADLVKEVINEIKPDVVCIELDEERYKNINQKENWSDTSLLEIIKKKKTGYMAVNLILGSYQKKIANKSNINVGQEMHEAINAAKENQAELVLADRNIQITFKRIWRKQNFFDKIKLLSALIKEFFSKEEVSEEEIAELMEKDMLTAALNEIGKEFPKIAEPLIYERDQYLANKIKNSKGNKIVAVLGKAHLVGVKEEIYKEQDMENLVSIPKKNPLGKILLWMVPLLIVTFIIFSFKIDKVVGIEQLKSWILYNGIFAAIGALLALANPITIIVCFIAGPITSLIPFFAAGFVAGIIELFLKSPTVKDFETLAEDVQSLKGIYRNRVTKILLIVLMVNLFSAIGTYASGFDIFKRLLEII